jgi:choice-of-anchor A domain-containing protein
MKHILTPGVALLLLSAFNPFSPKATAQCNNNTVLTVGASYLSSSFSGNGNFNAIIIGSDSLSGGDFEGRAAIGNNFWVNNSTGVGLGGGRPMPNSSYDNLIVNGVFANNFGNWQVNGNFIYNTYTGSLPSHASGQGTNIGGVTNHIQFANLLNYYKGLSSDLAARTANGTVSISNFGYRQVNLTGTSSTLNIFNVNIPTGTGGIGIDINVPANSDVVINVTSSSFTANGGAITLNNTTQNRILWNFTNATNIDLTSYAWLGSILAPYARLTGSGGNINGQAVIGGNVLHSNGFEFHNYCYEGTITYTPNQPPVPDNKYNKTVSYNSATQKLQLNAANATNINNGTRQTILSGTDPDGTIATYNIKTLPNSTVGNLYFKSGSTPTLVTSISQLPNNGMLTNADANSLYFKPAGSAPNDTVYATFTYTVTDNSGNESVSAATYTIPVVPGGTALGVKLESFSGSAVAGNAVLNWRTASEINNDHFDVERSTDGRSFTTVTSIKGNRTTGSAHNYTYTDALVANTVYYRLRQVDADGTATNSNIITIKTNDLSDRASAVYPNPFTDRLNILLVSEKEETVQLTVTDVTGKQLISQSVRTTAGQQLIGIDNAVSLPAGLYLLQVQKENGTENFRIVKH